MNQPLLLEQIGKFKGQDSMKRAYLVGCGFNVEALLTSVGFGITDVQEKADVVVFGGGADINPELYNAKPNKTIRCSYSSNEDARDMRAWKLLKPHQFKVGICRGGQFLNVMSGGSMYQHVSNHANNHLMYDALWGTSFVVTSHHHQMMIPSEDGVVFAYAEKIGKNFRKEADEVEAPDIEPEVIYYPKTRSVCIQFHPEWANVTSSEFKYFRKLMKEVVQNA